MGELTRIGKPRSVAVSEPIAKSDVQALEHTRKIVLLHMAGLEFDEWSECWHRDGEKAIEAAKAWILTDDYADAVREMQTATQPAPELFVRKELGKLVGAWPNASKADLQIYGAMLAEEVLTKMWSNVAVVAAFQKLRRTLRFLPTICEVLETLEHAEKEFQYTERNLVRLPGRATEKAKALADSREAMRPRTPEELAEAEAARIERKRKFDQEREERIRKACEQSDWSEF
jgi:hypothetical protein